MKTLILLISNDDEFNQGLIHYAQQHRQDTEWILPNDQQAASAEVAACWFPDNNTLSQFPNLKCLLAVSAGVDHLGSALLTSGLPICRIVNEEQQRGMFEFVLWGVLNAHRHFDRAHMNHAECHWQRYPQQAAPAIRVSILGLGVLGKYVAQSLAEMGYSVSGWSRSLKDIDNVTCFAGNASLPSMLKDTDILVNLLPLSPATTHILNKKLFDSLPHNAYIINCGRGGHVNEAELIQAVTQGHLRGALLDVFEEEPLSASNPLWQTKGILITPHMASEASLSSIVEQTSDNAKRFEQNFPLMNKINSEQGY
ncbi:2-hydroxyacid dehydrogenase [Marinomonas aquiplantarum]|uniref:Glyoxylate/hydroxypyruvate reductase A n=1 Tax=Marinomonas aquiplantarum TaxID=491951 RepID=A0A366CWH8_9GAMM|nr:glyoxylate/hydroxypyruvate reductase A [Marinomonas aquiplantarum]RBO82191.1 glyoxylate/hydroxypyruvate reductase A [Marinomonas aquiplantarum]